MFITHIYSNRCYSKGQVRINRNTIKLTRRIGRNNYGKSENGKEEKVDKKNKKSKNSDKMKDSKGKKNE